MAAAKAGSKKIVVTGNTITINGNDGIKIDATGQLNNKDIILGPNIYDGNPTDLEDSGLRTIAGIEPIGWKTYTPQVDQGASTDISKTVTFARYTRIGRLVHVECRLDMTGAGSGGNGVLVTLPVLPLNVNYHPIGSGTYFDSGTANYECSFYTNNNGSYAQFSASSVTAIGAAVGTNPNLAVASGDTILFEATYEAADGA